MNFMQPAKSRTRYVGTVLFAIQMSIALPSLASDNLESKAKKLYEAVCQNRAEDAAEMIELAGDAQEALKLIQATRVGIKFGPEVSYSVQLSKSDETITVYRAAGQSVQPVASVVFERLRK